MPTNRTAPKRERAAKGSISKRGAKSRAVSVPVEIVVDDGMTDQQRLFVEQYFINGMNATEAALAVYDTTDRHVAQVMGSENLSKPVIRARINERLDQFHLTANEVLARFAFHARGSMEEFIDVDSGTIDLKKARDGKKLGLIKKFRTKFTTTTKTTGDGKRAITEEIEVLETEIELHDAQAALVHLGKHLGLFQPEVNINNFNMLTDDQLEALANGKPVQVVNVIAESVK